MKYLANDKENANVMSMSNIHFIIVLKVHWPFDLKAYGNMGPLNGAPVVEIVVDEV